MNLTEAKKEKIPVSVYTDHISTWWSEVGRLKDEVKAISENFSDAKHFEKILNNIIDEYLIAIGQTESLLDEKKIVELPEEDSLNESITLKISLEDEEIEENECENCSENEIQLSEPFEFVVDFDEPSGEKLTDQDIYGE